MSIRALSLFLLVGCGPGLTSSNVSKDGSFEEETDEDPPVIVHDPVTGTQVFGEDVPISATITDDDAGIRFAYLHYKNEIDGDADWEQVILMADGDLYSGTIRGEDERGGGVYYYLEAVDKEQNTSFSPDDGDSDPYHFRLAE
jgi:hypothetical protein